MAIRELNSVVHANYQCLATADWHAGQVLALDTSTGLVRVANRGNSATAPSGVGDLAGAVVGLSADDTARTGNDMILVDPVGSTVVGSGVGSSATFTDNTNGFYVGSKRALGDYQAEIINGITNLTDDNGGYAGPRRGVAVFTTPSSQFVITNKAYALYQTATTNGTYLDQSLSGDFAPGDVLTYGSGTNAGKLVRRSSDTHGMAVARVDKYDSTGGLLYITLLMSL
jgi:hypothetical protein